MNFNIIIQGIVIKRIFIAMKVIYKGPVAIIVDYTGDLKYIIWSYL